MYIAQRKLHISKGNSKIGKIANLNLLCGDDNLNGKTDVVGSCVGCCESCKHSCYGRKSYRHIEPLVAHSDNTKYARHNLKGFFDDLNKWLLEHNPRYFRFHSHGEIIHTAYFMQMINTASRFPNTMFYVYTKRYAFVNQVLNAGAELPNNLTVIFSPPFTCKTSKDLYKWERKHNPYKLPLFVVDDHSVADNGFKDYTHCPAVDSKGKHTGVTCDKCGRCIHGKTTAVYLH